MSDEQDFSGFVDETRPDIAGWLRPEQGVTVHGRIVSAFAFQQRQRDGSMKKREVVAVALIEPATVWKDKKNMFKADPGQIVGLSILPCIANIRYYVETKGEFKLLWLPKEQIGGGWMAWRAKLGCKGKRAATAWHGEIQSETTSHAGESSGGEGDDDFGF